MYLALPKFKQRTFCLHFCAIKHFANSIFCEIRNSRDDILIPSTQRPQLGAKPMNFHQMCVDVNQRGKGQSGELTARTGRSQRFYQTIDIHLFILHPARHQLVALTIGAIRHQRFEQQKKVTKRGLRPLQVQHCGIQHYCRVANAQPLLLYL